MRKPLPEHVAYVTHGVTVPRTATPGPTTQSVVARVHNLRPGGATQRTAGGASLQGSRAHPAWETREIARRLAQSPVATTKLTRAQKRAARSRARAARHLGLGGTR